MIPPHFDLAPIERSEARLNVLLKLLKRKDVTGIVNACDAGREGELIFRYIAQYAKTKKPIERLWLQSMTQVGDPRRLRDAAQGPRPAAARRRREVALRSRLAGRHQRHARDDRLQFQGRRLLPDHGRARADADAGDPGRARGKDPRLPAARLLGSACALRRQGRRIRRAAGSIRRSRRTRIRSASPSASGQAQRAEAIAAACAGKPGTATEETKPSTQASPLLYDLTSLQREANGRFGFSAKGTLALAQSLYERHKALTYPRTDARALPEDYIATVKKTMDALAGVKEFAPFAKQVLKGGWVKPNKRIFDNSKISDHFAIIPTLQTPGHLSEPEAKLYDLVVRRFLAVFFPSAEFLQTTRITTVGEEQFRTDGRVMQSPGWLAVYGKSLQDETVTLPAIAQGEKVKTLEVKATANQTRPPARFNEATLLSAMEGAGKLVEDDELREAMGAKGLGTPATRAAVIEGLIYEKYVERLGRELKPTWKAFRLFFALRHFGVDEITSPELTGDWEFKLKQMEQAKLPREKFMEHIEQVARDLVKRVKAGDHSGRGLRHRCRALPEVRRRDPGDLPQVPVPVLRLLHLAGAAGPRLVARGSGRAGHQEVHRPADRLSQQAGQAVLGGPEADRRVQDRVRLRPGRGRTATSRSISAARRRSAPARNAARRVFEHGVSYVCEKSVGPQRSCDFRSGRMILQQPVERAQMQKLLATGRTDLLTNFMSKKNRKFKAFLVKTPQGKIGFEFLPRAEKPGKAARGGEARRRETAPRKRRREAAPRRKKRAEEAWLDVQVPDAERVRLDEGAARLDLVAHQLGEDLVGGDAVVDLHPAAAAGPCGSMVVSQSCDGFISPRPL